MAKSKKATKPTATKTKVRRVESDEEAGGSLLRGIIVIALVILGLFMIYNTFARDTVEDAVVTDKESKTEDAKKDDKADKSDKEKAAHDATQPGAVPSTTVNETDTAYEYTAGEGESYTTLARRAVTSVASGLTPAERVAAETKLAQDAGAEWLNAGQDLSLTKDAVRKAVDWAKGLSDEQKAAWQPYADLVAW